MECLAVGKGDEEASGECKEIIWKNSLSTGQCDGGTSNAEKQDG